MNIKFIFSPQIFPVYLFLMYVIIPGCNSTENGKGPIKTSNIEKIPAIRPVSYKSVRINDQFWKPKIEKNRLYGIRQTFKACSHSQDNFDIASGKKKGKHKGTAASDSDVYKIIQGAAYALYNHPDQELENYIDALIDRIVAAQQNDGYLFTYWTINNPEERWKDIERKHELYCAGHMFEAAVAYYEVTGKKKFLEAALRLADHIDSIFGPDKRKEVPGHQEIELALLKLYQTTSQKRYLQLSAFFLDERGNPERLATLPSPPEHDPYANTPRRYRPPSYRQDHLPVSNQREATGHAVRAAYLYSAMGEMATVTRSEKYLKALTAIWEDIITQKLYITGAIGTSEKHDEGFGRQFLLPNDKAYCETCSAIAFVFWNHRMNMLFGDSKYADVLELTLYNAAISGVSLSGDHFFYRNPLESSGKNMRRPWYEPGCCPSNVVRFLPHIGNYIYGEEDDGIYINQFIGNQADIQLKNINVKINMETHYPWEGKVNIYLNPEDPINFKLYIRIPNWNRGNPISGELYRFENNSLETADAFQLKLNGEALENPSLTNGYLKLSRTWKAGDNLALQLKMPIRKVKAHPNIVANKGKVALQRGPIIYCLEEEDNGAGLFELVLPVQSELINIFRSDVLGGVMMLEGNAFVKDSDDFGSKTKKIIAIPYYSWANRGQGKMRVWIPEVENPIN